MKKSFLLFVAGIFLSLTIRLFLIINGSSVADIHALEEMGNLTLQGVNPYIALNYNSYPPLALYLQAFTIQLSSLTDIPFYILIKLWPNLADLLITLTIFVFLTKKGVKKSSAYLWSLIFFLNPVSIIISASHGQIDSIPTFLVLLSIFLLTFKFTKFSMLLSALSLGLAIAVKPNPLILLPFFLIFRKLNLREILLFLAVTITPTFISLLPFLQDYPSHILSKIFNYSGSKDFGVPAILRGIYYLESSDYRLAFSKETLQISKFVFLTGLFFLILIFRNSGNLIKGCLAAYLLFYALYFGISAQYLSWILPLAVLGKDLIVIPFSTASLIALLGFYLFINPKILITQFSSIPAYQSQFMLLYVLGNLLLITVCLYWLFKILKSLLWDHIQPL